MSWSKLCIVIYGNVFVTCCLVIYMIGSRFIVIKDILKIVRINSCVYLLHFVLTSHIMFCGIKAIVSIMQYVRIATIHTSELFVILYVPTIHNILK